jgi:hypothetical protein
MTMTRRRTGYDGPTVPDNWHVSTSFQVGRKQATPGRAVTIRGERGTFRFVRHVVTEPADRRRKRREWIDVIGGTAGVTMFRSFTPDRIRKVGPVQGKQRTICGYPVVR